MRMTLFLLVSLVPLFSQRVPERIEAGTEGPCSPNVIANQERVVITCTGIADAETRQQIGKAVDILNEIYRRQGRDNEAFRATLEKILSSIKQVEEGLGPRRLTDRQKAFLNAGLTDAAKVPVTLTSILGDDGLVYAEELAFSFKGAGWDVVDVGQGLFTKTFVGVQLTVNEKHRNDLPSAIRQLAEILFEAGVLRERAVYVHQGVSPDQVEIRVGLRH